MDLNCVIEEVALEGLDGITLDALWLRIKRRPNFYPDVLDDYVKEYVWKNLVSYNEVEIYKLPKARPDLKILDYNELVYHNRCMLREMPDDVYSIEKIEKDGVVGACDVYDKRVSISKEVKGSNDNAHMTLKEAENKWGKHLVVVASQRLRFKAVLNTNYLPPGISAEAYIILERVARSRYIGVITMPFPSGRGLINKNMKTSNLHSLSKYLCSRGLLTKQAFNLRFNNGKPAHARLLHLTRFYTESKANFLKKMEVICNALQDAPDCQLERQVVLKEANVLSEDVKKHWNLMQKFIDKETVPFRSLYPDAAEEEYRCKNKKEKKLIVLRLVRPFVRKDMNDSDNDDDDGDENDMTHTIDDVDEDLEEDEEENDEDEKDIDREKPKVNPVVYGISESSTGSGPLYDLSFSRGLQYIIDQAGTSGISEFKLCQTVGLHVKTICKFTIPLLDAKSIVKVPYSMGTLNSHLLLSAQSFKRRSETIQKKAQLDVMKDTIQEDKDDGKSDVSPSKNIVKDGAKSLGSDDDSEQKLDETLTDLNLTWTIDKIDNEDVLKNPKIALTDKKKARRNFVLNHLALKKVCDSQYNLLQELRQWENSEGWKEAMCRKSFPRILSQLYKEGKICYIIVNSDKFTSTQDRKLLADASIRENDFEVKQGVLHFYINHFKFSSMALKRKDGSHKLLPVMEKPFSVCEALDKLGKKEENMKNFVKEEKNTESVGDEEDNIQIFTKVPEKRKLQTAKEYPKCCKLSKARLLHKFMYYILYDYPKGVDASVVPGDENVAASSQDPTRASSWPVYFDVNDWRRYIPPLKVHNMRYLKEMNTEGVCMLGDLLMTIPIGLFCKIVTIRWEVEGLAKILNDPDLQHRPLYATPSKTLKDITVDRGYMWKFQSVINMLVHMGLASYGPRTGLRALEYMIIYVHKKAMVMDTITSLPGRTMTKPSTPEACFSPIHFTFQNLNDLEMYWDETRLICLGTKLGQKSPADVPGFRGEISLLDAVKPRPLEDIKEENWLPGDQRGAGGFDSSLYMHQLRNWNAKAQLQTHKRPAEVVAQALSKKASSIKRTKREPLQLSKTLDKPTKKSIVKGLKSKIPRQKKPLDKSAKGRSKDANKEGNVANNGQTVTNREVGKQVKSSPVYKSRSVMDDIDRKAKRAMGRLRSAFTPLENGIFLLCHVTSFLLYPKAIHIRLPSPEIRTIFRSLAPELAKDKTTSAIKGKSARLIRDRNFLSHMSIYVAKARYDEELMAKYKGFRFLLSRKAKTYMFETFFDLVKKLQVKFSSKECHLSYNWPSTSSELHRQYEIKYALNPEHLYEGTMPKCYFDVSDSSSIRANGLWDLILGWMHSHQSLPNVLLYYILSKYPEEAINKTYNSLKKFRVLLMHKKYTYYHGRRTMSSEDSQAVSSLVLSRRHRDGLKSHFPTDVFLHARRQLLTWESHCKGISTTPSTGTTGDEEGNKGAAGASDSHDNNEIAVGDESRSFSLDVKNLQGSSFMALLPLMVLDLVDVDLSIPDEMVCLSEEGVQQLTFKKSGSKRKSDVLDTSLEDSNDEDDGDDNRFIRSNKFVKRRKKAMMSGLNSTKASTSNDVDDSSGANKRHKIDMKVNNIHMHFNDIECSSEYILNDLSISLASGYLIALARTSMFEDIDPTQSKSHTHRFLILDPLVMKFTLKEIDVNDNDDNDNKYLVLGTNSHNKIVQKTKAKDEETPHSSTSSPFKQPQNLSTDSQSRSSSVADLSIPAKNHEGTVKPKKPSSQKKSCLSLYNEHKIFQDVLTRVEQCFPIDFEVHDVNEELDAIAGKDCGGWVEEGRQLFSFIDSCGPTGVTEPDFECKFEKPFFEFQSTLSKLRDMNAVSTNTTFITDCFGEFAFFFS